MNVNLKKTLYLPLFSLFIVFAAGCKFKNSTSGSPECKPAYTIFVKDQGVDYLEFIALGDAGTGGDGQKAVAGAMGKYATQNPVEFVLYLGDNFIPDGVDSVYDEEFQTHFEQIYDKTLLNIPFYVVLGNHDYRGNIYAQLEYTNHSSRWRMPYFYYTFTINHNGSALCQFFALDTTPIVKWDRINEQMTWLEEELAGSTARWKIVFGHHPIYSNGKQGDCDDMKDEVLPLLEKYNVDVYLCGHDHDLQILDQSNGVNYLVSGAGAQLTDTNCGNNTIYASSQLGFMAFCLSADEIVISVILADGRLDFCHVIPKS
jgi:tartrate-resistant acid phosphatase type 5